MNANTLKALRKAVKKRPEIVDGTVIRFDIRWGPRDDQVFTYIAIFEAGWWYTSAQGPARVGNDGLNALVNKRMSQRALENLLSSPQVSDVAVATGWTEL